MNCQKCGASANEWDIFCERCGELLISPAEPAQQQVQPAAMSAAPVAPVAPPVYQPPAVPVPPPPDVPPVYQQPLTPAGQTPRTPYTGYPPDMPQKQKSGAATSSLVLGIISIVTSLVFFISIPLGIVSIILAAVAKKKTRKLGAGFVCGLIGTVLSVVILLMIIAGTVFLEGNLEEILNGINNNGGIVSMLGENTLEVNEPELTYDGSWMEIITMRIDGEDKEL